MSEATPDPFHARTLNFSPLGARAVYRLDVLRNIGDRPRQEVTVKAERLDGSTAEFTTIFRADTPVEVEYYRNGGILHTVLRKQARN